MTEEDDDDQKIAISRVTKLFYVWAYIQDIHCIRDRIHEVVTVFGRGDLLILNQGAQRLLVNLYAVGFKVKYAVKKRFLPPPLLTLTLWSNRAGNDASLAEPHPRAPSARVCCKRIIALMTYWLQDSCSTNQIAERLFIDCDRPYTSARVIQRHLTISTLHSACFIHREHNAYDTTVHLPLLEMLVVPHTHECECVEQ